MLVRPKRRSRIERPGGFYPIKVGQPGTVTGGNGIVADYNLARFFSDAEALYSYEGTYQMQNLIVGKAITGHGAFI
jgi:hypothetical protein